jgi:hypothetical protein
MSPALLAAATWLSSACVVMPVSHLTAIASASASASGRIDTLAESFGVKEGAQAGSLANRQP